MINQFKRHVSKEETKDSDYPKASNMTKLCIKYGVCRQTLKKWIEPFAKQIGPVQGKVFTPLQVKIIEKVLGPNE